MAKKIIASIICGLLVFSAVGCSKEDGTKTTNPAPKKAQAKAIELPGSWAKDYSREELLILHNEILKRVEEVTLEYGLNEEYEIKEEIREENGISINDNRIYLDIENPETNRLASMYYGFKQYGSDLATGDISMKLGFNLGIDEIKKAGEFKFEDTSLAKFSEAFTNVKGRDYSELNRQIYDMILHNTNIETIENNLDGLKESITIMDNYLQYKLESKTYNFK